MDPYRYEKNSKTFSPTKTNSKNSGNRKPPPLQRGFGRFNKIIFFEFEQHNVSDCSSEEKLDEPKQDMTDFLDLYFKDNKFQLLKPDVEKISDYFYEKIGIESPCEFVNLKKKYLTKCPVPSKLANGKRLKVIQKDNFQKLIRDLVGKNFESLFDL